VHIISIVGRLGQPPKKIRTAVAHRTKQTAKKKRKLNHGGQGDHGENKKRKPGGSRETQGKRKKGD
jgi:hypothetical protein